MATKVIRYVNTASTAGGNGTTNDTAGANRAYATLNAALAAEAKNLVSADEQFDFMCTGTSADTTAATVSSTWVTDATRYVAILPQSGQEPTMPWSTSRYRLVTSTGFGAPLTVATAYCTVSIQIENTVVATDQPEGVRYTASSGVLTVNRAFVRFTGSGTAGTTHHGIRLTVGTGVQQLKVRNTVITGFRNAIVSGASSVPTLVIYNTTMIGRSNGTGTAILTDYTTGPTYRLKNNLDSGFNTSVELYGASVTSDYATNATTTGASVGTGSRTSQTFTFVDAGGGDYHLSDSDAGAKDYGTDLSADTYQAFSDDFDGATRTGTWDIGADQVTPVGPTIDTQPTAQTARLNGDATTTATFTVAATGTGGLTYDWELETSVGGGSYSNLADGSGATWTGQAASSCVGTFTAKTLSGRRVRCNVTDSNGTTTTNAVTLTVLDGPVLSASSASTNGSGQVAPTMTSDDALTANGEILLITMDVEGQVLARTTVRPA